MTTISISHIHACKSTFDDADMVPFKRAPRTERFEGTKRSRHGPKTGAGAMRVQGDRIGGKLRDAQAVEETVGYEPLSGSPKQVSWEPQVRMNPVQDAFRTLGLDESNFNTRAGNPTGQSDSAS